MTLEETIKKMHEMFPEGIPNAAGEVFAHRDAPVQTYAQVRKLLGLSSAFMQRRAWVKFLKVAEENKEPPVINPK